MPRISPEQVAIAHEVLALDPDNAPPPDWRWRLGGHLARNKRIVPAKWIDPWVCTAALMHLSESNRTDPAKALPDQPPGAPGALAIYRNRTSFQRWELEARLLAGESSGTIAQKCNSTPDTVEAYHQLFYCVRPALDAPVYTRILPAKVHTGLSEDDVELLLKVYGYNRGPVFLDAMVDYYQAPLVVPAGLDQLDEAAMLRLTNKIWVRAVILGRTLPIDSRMYKQMAVLSKAVEVLHKHGLNDQTAPMICAAFGIEQSTLATAACQPQPVAPNADPERHAEAASAEQPTPAKVA
jgi:hypothetical protein